MVRRLLVSGVLLLLIVLFVPACSHDSKTGRKDTRPDEAVPAPRPGGKAG